MIDPDIQESDAVAFLRKRNRFEVTLETGLQCEIRLPDMNDAVLSGDIPMPVLDYMTRQALGDEKKPEESKPEENGKTPNLDFLRQFRLYQRELVMRALCAVVDNGQWLPCEMNMDAVLALQPQEFDELYAYGSRHQPIPKAVTPQ